MSDPASVALPLPGAPSAPPHESRDTWRPLGYFNLYRAALAGLFTVLALLEVTPTPVPGTSPRLFLGASLAYLALSALGAVAIRRRRPDFETQVVGQVVLDVAALTLMMHASGGIGSGFGLLLLVAVAGGSILTGGRTALAFAGLATLGLVAPEVLVTSPDPAVPSDLTQAGLLGAALFATAVLAQALARRVRESEALALQRGVDLANLARLNEHILQRMQSGILAADPDGRLRLANESARRLLGLPRLETGMPLSVASPELADLVERWQQDREVSNRTFRPPGAGTEVIASLAAIAQPGTPAALIFLEDLASVTQRAQHLKLASLGRLTASIAHEIRNPLAAISHAAQLLQESADLPEGDQRLTRIIRDQSQRLNTVVENVLQLSRRRDAELQRFGLRPWLEELVAELERQRGLADGALTLAVDPATLEVRADPTQLRQVLLNLCENGLRYAVGRPLLRLTAGVNPESDRPFIEVCDSGAGVPEEVAEHLFEPFFTTERHGTGLGLYIARELCEANQAVLDHLGRSARGHCFRITFTHPARRSAPPP